MVQDRLTSRLAQRERSKLLRQTVFYLIGAVIVCAGFIFLVLPSFIKIINVVFGGAPSIEISDDIPPQTPVITAPVPATSSAQLSVKGFTEPQGVVVIVLNGQQVLNDVTAKDDGSFETTLALTEGVNTFSLFARDAAKNESQVTKTYSVLLDTFAPELIVDKPTDKQSVVGKNNQTMSVVGSTDPENKIFINDRLVFPNSEGDFSSTYRLNDGDNTLVIKAVDKAGNLTEKSLMVTFKP